MVEELETVHPKGKTNLADLESSQLSANSGFAIPEIFLNGFLYPPATLSEIWIPEKDQSESAVVCALLILYKDYSSLIPKAIFFVLTPLFLSTSWNFTL